MLKRYDAPEHVRWVGKAWEIRYALRQELKLSGGQTRMAEWSRTRQTAGLIGSHRSVKC